MARLLGMPGRMASLLLTLSAAALVAVISLSYVAYTPGSFPRLHAPGSGFEAHHDPTSAQDDAGAGSKPPPPVPSCQAANGASDVMVVVRTSAMHARQRLPQHILSLLACAPHSAIFSDRAGELAGHTIHDALAGLLPATKSGHNEFRYYDRLQKQRAGVGAVDAADTAAADALDRWKFLPMVHQARQQHADAAFYVFLPDDTALSWTNLLQWTRRLDPHTAYFAGAPGRVRDVRFARRSSAFVLSRAAMDQFAATYETSRDAWERRSGGECCGDVILGHALRDAGVDFASAVPLLRDEPPDGIVWTAHTWCAPVVAWPHLAHGDVYALWETQHAWATAHVRLARSSLHARASS